MFVLREANDLTVSHQLFGCFAQKWSCASVTNIVCNLTEQTINMKYLTFLLLSFPTLFFGCSSNETSDNNSAEVAVVEASNQDSLYLAADGLVDGFYLIINTWEDSSLVRSSNGKVISYSRHFLGDNTNGQPLFIEVDTSEFVPLSLSKKPERVEQEDKRIKLVLSMTDSASAMLERFTEKNLNQKTCIVIGDKAVTMHKIREKITEGKIQITRCTDNACQYLLLELEDNVED